MFAVCIALRWISRATIQSFCKNYGLASIHAIVRKWLRQKDIEHFFSHGSLPPALQDREVSPFSGLGFA